MKHIHPILNLVTRHFRLKASFVKIKVTDVDVLESGHVDSIVYLMGRKRTSILERSVIRDGFFHWKNVKF